jgi:hypothetical protein
MSAMNTEEKRQPEEVIFRKKKLIKNKQISH